jgi:pyruvate,water dikinase
MAYACPLGIAQPTERCGGKAYNLGRMIRLGLPVPQGVVVTDRAFQEFLDDNDLRTPIAALLEDLDPRKPKTFQITAKAIRNRILSTSIPTAAMESIRTLLAATLPGATLIVRSSAVGEDSLQAAFAGQLDSYLYVNSDRALEQAILGCWASCWSERCLSYQFAKGIHLTGMGVVVQELVPSRISGVLFTRHPESSSAENDSLIAEYCFGHGDALVSGRINPGQLLISRTNDQWRVFSKPEQDDRTHDDRLIDDRLISILKSAALRLEAEFGSPQDIEWTVDPVGELYLLQSRPITVHRTASAGSTQSTALHLPETRQTSCESSVTRKGPSVVWSNANVNENYPSPISPLLYSIASAGYYHYFRNLGLAFGISPQRVQAMEYSLRNIIGVHGARMYYNLTSIHAVLGMAPLGESLIEWFNSFVGTTGTARSPNAAPWHTFRRNRLTNLMELCRIALKTTLQLWSLPRRVATFERTVTDFAAHTVPRDLPDRTLLELLDDLRSFMDIRCHQWTNAATADAAAMVSYGILKQMLRMDFPDQDASSLHNTLLKGLPDVVSSVPITRLWELSRLVLEDAELMKLFNAKENTELLDEICREDRFTRFRAQLNAFTEDWGFRCSGELMLTVPSFQENPAALLDVLRAYLEREGESPGERLQRQACERAKETARVLKTLKRRKLVSWLPWPTRSSLLGLVLRWAQKSITLRERARLKQALLYSRCRRIALEIGNKLVPLGLLDDRDDVFYLTFPEIECLLAGSAMFPHQTKEVVKIRKVAHAELSRTLTPDTFELTEGSYLTADDRPSPTPSEVIENRDPLELSGIGVCGGRVTARAAILNDLSELHRLTEGDVLVTRQTDPGWALVFFLIKGLVMERGGMLSHGAILAREYGIPTVVAVKDATRRIAQGQTVLVNGDRGVVQLTS